MRFPTEVRQYVNGPIGWHSIKKNYGNDNQDDLLLDTRDWTLKVPLQKNRKKIVTIIVRVAYVLGLSWSCRGDTHQRRDEWNAING